MAKVKIQGHASGTGILTVTAPDTDVNRTITLPDATGTLLNSDGSAASLTAIPAANITGTLPAISGASLTGLADNTPAFLATPAIADSSLSDDTWTKVDYTEVVDSDGCYSSGRFTPAVVGYYQFNATAEVSTASPNAWAVYIALYKNGSIDNSTIMYIDGHAGRAAASMSTSGVIYLDADDYIEVFAKQNTQGLDFAIGTEGQFSAFKLIGVQNGNSN